MLHHPISRSHAWLRYMFAGLRLAVMQPSVIAQVVGLHTACLACTIFQHVADAQTEMLISSSAKHIVACLLVLNASGCTFGGNWAFALSPRLLTPFLQHGQHCHHKLQDTVFAC